MEHELVVKSNKLIEAGFKLSLNEQRVILMAITHVRRDRVLSSDEVFEIKATDFMTLFGMNQNKAYEELQNAAQRYLNVLSLLIIQIQTTLSSL